MWVLAVGATSLLIGCDAAAKNEASAPEGSASTAVTTPSQLSSATGKGSEIGFVYEAYLSPQQEGGEEDDTPKGTPEKFKSTAPSRKRNDRKERGHARVSFTRDLSKAIVEVEVSDLKIEDINMFHIHCGRPSMLGPIMVDFAMRTDIQKNFNDDGVLALEVTNEDIEAEIASGEGVVGAFLAGCPIAPQLKDKAKTIGGMEYIAREGDLYLNLHTYGQTYYGDIRGQLYPAFTTDDPIDTKVAPADAPAPSADAPAHNHGN